VQGFLQLCDQVREHGPDALDAFYTAAAALVRDRVPGWRSTWASGPLAAAQRTGDQLELLGQGSSEHLRHGRLAVLAPPAERAYGMCGRLLTFPSE
jgi:hypothetical protein